MATSAGNAVLSYTPEVLSQKDYFPFGMGMMGRSMTAEGYRYGFNGKEEDDEGMGGGGQTYDYGFRIYNPGLAKFLSVDPLAPSYPWYTPYQFAGNKPIWAVDLDGLEEYKVTGNTITISMKYAVFTSRPEGGNVPNGLDVVSLSKKHWEEYNKENALKMGLCITYDSEGNVTDVSVGEDHYKIVFDVEIQIFSDENSAEFLEFSKSKAFSGVYLFGDTSFGGTEIKHKEIELSDDAFAPAFTDPIAHPDFNNKEIVAFRDENYFTKTTEVHEDGHTLGLGHLGVNAMGSKMPQYKLLDSHQGTVKCYEDSKMEDPCYDSEGMMKDDRQGSQAMKLTQVINVLNSTDGKKND